MRCESSSPLKKVADDRHIVRNVDLNRTIASRKISVAGTKDETFAGKMPSVSL